MVFSIIQNWSLHLRIGDRIQLIPISMTPLQVWWCKNWIFVDENKNPVTAPPYLHWNHWYGYQMKRIINSEVQGLYQKSPALCTDVYVGIQHASLYCNTTNSTSFIKLGSESKHQGPKHGLKHGGQVMSP